MADTFQWLKLMLDNWKTLLTIFTLLTGWAVDNSLKAEQVSEAETVAKIYANVASQQHVRLTKPEHKVVNKIHKVDNCSICTRIDQKFNQHMRLH